MTPLAHRFWPRVAVSSGCWVWTGSKDRKGYGAISISVGRQRCYKAHRVAWLLARGPIQAGMHVLHHCDNPPCVNPDHLFLGTNKDNVADRDAKGRHAKLRGALNGQAKLTLPQVDEIRREYATRKVSKAELARRYGVSAFPIWEILTGRSGQPCA